MLSLVEDLSRLRTSLLPDTTQSVLCMLYRSIWLPQHLVAVFPGPRHPAAKPPWPLELFLNSIIHWHWPRYIVLAPGDKVESARVRKIWTCAAHVTP